MTPMEEDEQVGRAIVIGAVARETGMSAKTIRYYEESGLLPAPERAANGYRLYGGDAVHMVRFVKRARDLGFSMNDVGELLALWRDHHRASGDVKKLAMRHIRRVDQNIAELEGLRRTLVHLVERCHGDSRTECPILEDIAGTDRRRGTEARSRAGRSSRPPRSATSRSTTPRDRQSRSCS